MLHQLWNKYLFRDGNLKKVLRCIHMDKVVSEKSLHLSPMWGDILLFICWFTFNSFIHHWRIYLFIFCFCSFEICLLICIYVCLLINLFFVRVWVEGWGKDSVVQSDGLLLIQIKQNSNKNHPVGENKLAWQDNTGQDRTGQDRTGQERAGQGRIHPGWNDDELAQNCKYKKIIMGANEEGNKGRQVGKINQ